MKKRFMALSSLWKEEDLNLPKHYACDLQSHPFDHSGIFPYTEMDGFEPPTYHFKGGYSTIELHPYMASILDRTPRPAHSFFIKQRIIALSLLLGLIDSNNHPPVRSAPECTPLVRNPKDYHSYKERMVKKPCNERMNTKTGGFVHNSRNWICTNALPIFNRTLYSLSYPEMRVI